MENYKLAIVLTILFYVGLIAWSVLDMLDVGREKVKLNCDDHALVCVSHFDGSWKWYLCTQSNLKGIYGIQLREEIRCRYTTADGVEIGG